MFGTSALYFCHIPRTGGTTLVTWVRGHLSPEQMYPAGTADEMLAQKILPRGLSQLTAEQRARIRFYSPHLPVSAHELLDVDLALATLVRDPLDQIRSVLDMDAASGADLYQRFQGSQTKWYSANQLGWYLGADLQDVLAVFDRLSDDTAGGPGLTLDAAMREVMEGRSLVDAACSRLEALDAVGLHNERQAVNRAIASWLAIDVPAAEQHLNQGIGTPLTAELVEALEEITGDDREIYAHARAIVRSRLRHP